MRWKKNNVQVWELLVVIMIFLSLCAVIVSADSSVDGDEKTGMGIPSTPVVHDETDAITSVVSSPSLSPYGNIAGRVTAANGTGIYNAYIVAYGGGLEYSRVATRTDTSGYYSFTGLPVGPYVLIVYPVPGTDLLSNMTYALVFIGGTTPADVVLQPAPDIGINPRYFDMILSQGAVADRTLTIINNGTGILEFELPAGSWIFADPIEGALVDITNGYAWVNSTHITFWIETSTFIPDNTSGMMAALWFDTDQNASTGIRDEWYPGYGLNDLGADYFVLLDPYNFKAALYRWTGDPYEFISDLVLDVNAFCFEFSIPLSDLADEGLMDVTFVVETSGNVLSDVAPDTGHGTTGTGTPWLTKYPTTGTVDGDSLTEIIITITTADLDVGDYTAAMLVKNNDPDENPIVPVNLTILPRELGYFDTGSPASLYPSVAGRHNGTIRLNETIMVSQLYTYHCPGTGGHTEYVRIWNSTDWNVTATWNGYTGDWHNLSFDDSSPSSANQTYKANPLGHGGGGGGAGDDVSGFTLYANKTYNYTIVTGSYPQIIHEQSWNATGGVITCEEFVDSNGKRHNGWIPAIRLS